MAEKTNAKEGNQKPVKSFEESLWETATRLRGSIESSEYKHVVLSLIFLKFVSDKFQERRAELVEESKEDYLDMVEFYTMRNVFYLPETSRWSYIQQHAKQGDIAIKIDSALTAVEKSNASLKGALPDNYFSRLGLDASKLSALIDAINNIDDCLSNVLLWEYATQKKLRKIKRGLLTRANKLKIQEKQDQDSQWLLIYTVWNEDVLRGNGQKFLADLKTQNFEFTKFSS